MEFIKEAVIVCAAFMLFATLLPVRRLLNHLPNGASRRGWHWLSALLVTMIGCYVGYALGHQANWALAEELVIPCLLLFGSWFIFMVSQLSASGISDARRLASLEHQCMTDGLTGIFNRRYFDQQVLAEQKRARRQKQPMSLMLIDIDHFKQFNDSFGHQAGDQVLIRVCQLISSLSRSNDVVARYGGEEIAVIASGNDLEAAAVQAERLRKTIAETKFDLGRGTPQRVTVSIGVTQAHGLDAGQSGAIIGRADKALYLAKESGRNRVERLHERRSVARITHLQEWKATRGNEDRAA
ncbi:MAG: GGDEF domain-containing protein [Oceanococcus sp.]